jgi:anti-sigma factor RsiW
MSQHPTAETIAAYLSGRLSASDRVMLETHLSGCRECRQEVMSARRLLKTSPRRVRWQLVVPAAAAAILALALLGRGLFSPPVEEEIVRAPAGEAASGARPSLQVVSPANEATVERDSVVFSWTGYPGRPLYRLTLTDAGGATIWTRNTADTSVSLPADLRLAPGRSYFWYVDALDSSGQSLTTGTRRFSTSP